MKLFNQKRAPESEHDKQIRELLFDSKIVKMIQQDDKKEKPKTMKLVKAKFDGFEVWGVFAWNDREYHCTREDLVLWAMEVAASETEPKKIDIRPI